MRVMVTGAGGFVGSALCARLSDDGYEVVGLSRDPTAAQQRIGANKAVSVRAGSVADPNQVATAARGCDVVFHCAGLSPLPAPARVLRWVNVAGTENVLNALRHVKVPRLVHVSCADVTLHHGDRMHWDEKRVLPGQPVGPHARSKLVAEEIALSASDEALTVTAIRPAFLWGPGDYDGIARLSREARSTGFALYGGGRNLPATTHIRNLVAALVHAATAENVAACAYYVTDGEFSEAREFFGKLLAALGLPAPSAKGNAALAVTALRMRGLFGERRDDELARILARSQSALFDLSQARKDLGYEPGVHVETAMGELADWLKAQGGLDAVVARARPAASEADVAAQVAAAGGE
jgi:nucleoside-diphosphate-sugar epimerase